MKTILERMERKRIAAQALQGLLSNPVAFEKLSGDELCAMALERADQLVKMQKAEGKRQKDKTDKA